MINQKNLITKSLLGLFLLCFVVSGYTDASNYEVGDVFQSKKRTSSVILYRLKNDILADVRRDEETGAFDINNPTGGFRQRDTRYLYEVQKGDRIILLKSLEEGQLFLVSLVPKKKAKYLDNPYFYVIPKKFNQLVFVEHLTE